jgi:pimeloyl-ACP methyl ester carboxylesterase
MKLKLNALQQALSLCCLFMAISATAAEPAVSNVVLVHGSFADGSGWRDVADELTKDGFKVAIVQEPETSFAADVSAVQRVVKQMSGPVVLVGHSYGGAVITQAGNDAQVQSLVYIAAFQPDSGEATGPLSQKIPAATKGIAPTPDGYLFVKEDVFASDFAADVPKKTAAFLAQSQVYTAADAFGTPITTAAWRSKPSWAVVSTDDRMINPDLERFMTKRAGSTTIEIKASHAVYVSHPKEVVAVIERAAQSSK